MTDPRALSSLYNVVAMLEPTVCKVPFSRAHWPRHVTVSRNFEADLPLDELASLITEVAAAQPGFTATSGRPAAFGTKGEIAVVLVEPGTTWSRLHTAFQDALSFAGARFTTPYVRDEFRAHATDTRAGPWTGSAEVSALTVAAMDATTATLIADFPFAARDPGTGAG
jgi:2'-5' RNA ligase